MVQFLALLAALYADPEVKVLASAILLNAVLAIALAILGGTFSWQKLADFARKQVVPYLVVWGVLKVFDNYSGLAAEIPGIGTLGAMSSTFFAAALTALIAKAVSNIQALLPQNGAASRPH